MKSLRQTLEFLKDIYEILKGNYEILKTINEIFKGIYEVINEEFGEIIPLKTLVSKRSSIAKPW